ncbi:MAG: hypothetical protein KIS91_03330 [Anaerolineae bacterium]|nr:hypothetical protein [Anaerolineae bacterium]
MNAQRVEAQIVEVLRTLPSSRQAEVLDFALFLRAQQMRALADDERRAVLAEMRAAFANVSPDEIERQVDRAVAEVREEYQVRPADDA